MNKQVRNFFLFCALFFGIFAVTTYVGTQKQTELQRAGFLSAKAAHSGLPGTWEVTSAAETLNAAQALQKEGKTPCLSKEQQEAFSGVYQKIINKVPHDAQAAQAKLDEIKGYAVSPDCVAVPTVVVDNKYFKNLWENEHHKKLHR